MSGNSASQIYEQLNQFRKTSTVMKENMKQISQQMMQSDKHHDQTKKAFESINDAIQQLAQLSSQYDNAMKQIMLLFLERFPITIFAKLSPTKKQKERSSR
ncbi:hypothetical protein [Paenibacillus sp. N3.4]|uniref:hypothetical protein n=1 Tax=Paenibacillus sp. N3.4 TaxID=2603222 RepID=UPI0021C29880|nr:hypothetical protein [Paenibacillus sp. N3.4]